MRRLNELDHEIGQSDQAILALARADETARRLMSVPGIGPVTASALAASIQDISAFSGPREFALPWANAPAKFIRRQGAAGASFQDGKPISRKLLVVGAHAVLFHRKRCSDALRSWADRLMETKPFKPVAVATANKRARIAFVLMRDDARYAATPA